MKASEILGVILLSPLGIFGGSPGVIAFAVGITVLVVASVAKEKERAEQVARHTAQLLRDTATTNAPRAR